MKRKKIEILVEAPFLLYKGCQSIIYKVVLSFLSVVRLTRSQFCILQELKHIDQSSSSSGQCILLILALTVHHCESRLELNTTISCISRNIDPRNTYVVAPLYDYNQWKGRLRCRREIYTYRRRRVYSQFFM